MKKSLFLLFLALIFIACDEDDHDDDHDHDEHFEPVTWVISDEAGNTYMEITNPDFNEAYNSNFTMTVDQEAEFTIVFLDEDGDVSEPEEGEHTLAVVIDDETVADLHGIDGFSFELHALAVGSTEIELQVEHDGHVDARTVKIPLIVQ